MIQTVLQYLITISIYAALIYMMYAWFRIILEKYLKRVNPKIAGQWEFKKLNPFYSPNIAYDNFGREFLFIIGSIFGLVIIFASFLLSKIIDISYISGTKTVIHDGLSYALSYALTFLWPIFIIVVLAFAIMYFIGKGHTLNSAKSRIIDNNG